MKRTLIGALCLSLLATGCSDQPQQPEAEPESQPTTEISQTISEAADAISEGKDEIADSPAVAESTSEDDEQIEEDVSTEEEGPRFRRPNQEEMQKNIDASFLSRAIENHSVIGMRELIKKGLDLEYQAPESLLGSGNTYATECVLANFPEGLKVLKEFDFDFDMRNKRNGAPALLCVAAKGGDFNRLEMARILLECGASVDAEVENPEDPSLDGLTPLYLALHRAFFENDKESLEVAQFLLKHGADPDKTPVCNEGQTMLQTAIFKKNFPAVEFLLKHGASVTKARDDGATALKIVTQRGTPAKIRQAVAANVKVCDFTIFGITLGQPLPKEIDKQINWAADNDPFDDPLWGGRGTDETEDTSALWKMPKRFRRFNQTLSITRTPSSHRISQIGTIALIDGELQQKEEAEVVRDALVKKFGIDFQENSYAQTWTGYKDGAEIHIWYREDHVGLMISVADEETLELIDDLSRERADDVETDLDVL